MSNTPQTTHEDCWFLPGEALGGMTAALMDEGYTVIAPVIRDGAIVMRQVRSAVEIAAHVRDEQEGGHYRLIPSEDDTAFDYVVGPDGPKRFFFPPSQRLFSLHVEGERLVFDTMGDKPPKLAFIGVRGCELAGIAMQDRVFGIERGQGTFRCESETYYSETRRQALLIAVNCVRPGGTCFCDSWGTGPRAQEGYDLALTPLRGGFVATVGSQRGAALVERLSPRRPTEAELELEQLKLDQARRHMGRHIDPQAAREVLENAIEHPRWDETAGRCLSCGNCTMVCPTCFCSTVTDSSDLTGQGATRTRQWESCFTHQFSYTTPGPVRNSIRARYRHWLRHKLCTWWEQFDGSGCVGCGRCITWCPVGIDLTEEVQAIRGNHRAGADSSRARESEARP